MLGPSSTDTITALNAALTIVTIALCNHPSGPIPATPYEAGGVSDQSLKNALADALACLPLIDKGNRMVEKCAKFVATLQQCLNLLGTLHQGRKNHLFCSYPSNSYLHCRPNRT